MRGLLAALAVGTVTRATVFAIAVRHRGRFVTSDSREYEALARHFGGAYGHGDLLALTLRRPPGYPALIALLGNSVTATIVAELVLSLATIAGVWLLALRLAGPVAATAAAFLLALDPVSVAMSSNLTTETLFAAIWLGAVLLWLRGGLLPVAAAGLIFGLSVLVRPIAEWLFVPLVPLTFALRQRAAAAALLVAFALPVGLWIVRNHHETGVATVSTIGATNLLDYRAAGALASDDGISRVDAQNRLEAQIHADPNPAREAQQRSTLAWRTLRQHPAGAVVITAEGLGRVLFGPARAELLRLVRGRTTNRGVVDDAILAAEVALLGVLLALAATGGVVLVRRRAWLALAATATFVLYIVVLSAGPEADARLRMPATPFLAVLAGVAVSSLVDRSAARRASRSR